MASGHATGLRAEFWAALYLRLKGYRVLEQRFKTPLGEIDMVVRRGRRLAFVEVKWRATAAQAAEAIHSRNRDRVRRAAALYLQRHPEYTGWEVGFDALVMAPRAWPRHMRNAW